jgi:hypothetical protein
MMQSSARIVHRTAGRLRLRIPERRKDTPFFVSLYEELRQIPEVSEVVINPMTGSLLLLYPEDSSHSVLLALEQIGLLAKKGKDQEKQVVFGPILRVFSGTTKGATPVRTVLLVIVIGLAVHQVRRGKLLAPVLTVLWYAYDLVSAHGKEEEYLHEK